MPFPEASRVIYTHNPLNNVLCQLRFPPILKIDSDLPSTFQDRLRNEYPLFNEKTEVVQTVFNSPDNDISQEMLNQLNKSFITKNHEFTSSDHKWSINLTRTFIALSTKNYLKWEEFKERLETVFNIFTEIYQPPFFTRIGLRYVDIVKRSVLNLEGVEWKELIQPHILGILSTNVDNSVKSFNNKYEIELADKKSIVKISSAFVKAKQDNEQCFLLDSDFFNAFQTNKEGVFEKLDFLHLRATRLLKWSITERLHLAMVPVEIKSNDPL